MVLIPAGVFQIGDTFKEGAASELLVNDVHIDAFYMDVYEVTNQQYADALNWAYGQRKFDCNNSMTRSARTVAEKVL